MDWIYFILFGALAGWIAGQLFKGKSFGLIGNVVIGVIGGVLGGWLFDFLNITTSGGFIGSLITSVAGAGVLVLLAGMIKGK